MNKENKHECDYTDFIKCPHCGYENNDSWESLSGWEQETEQQFECGSCELSFVTMVEYSVTFTSRIPIQICDFEGCEDFGIHNTSIMGISEKGKFGCETHYYHMISANHRIYHNRDELRRPNDN